MCFREKSCYFVRFFIFEAMLSRLFLLLKLWALTMVVFALQKPLFLLYNVQQGVKVGDFAAVAWHGLLLDMTTAAYTLVVPWVVLFGSMALQSGHHTVIRLLQSYYWVVSLLISLIFVVDMSLYAFWGFKLDATVFIYTDKPGDALASVSLGFVVLRLLMMVALTLLYGYAYYTLLNKYRLKAVRYKGRSWLMMLAVAALLFVMIRGSVGKGTSNVTMAYYSDNMLLNHAAVNPVFNMLYSMSHRQDFAQEHQYFDKQELERLMAGIYHTESIHSDSLLRTQRPDIVLVVWEGCGRSMVGCLGGDARVTPQLNRLAEEGVLFSNCQSNSYRTDRGLVCIMAGWLGFPSTSLMKMPEKCESLPGIAKSLRKAGYATDFWYGGDISFTNMGGFMLQNGFQKTYSERDFPRTDQFSEWGVADGTVFDRVLEHIRQRGEKEHPYFTSIMTLTSHEPWMTPYRLLDDEIENSFAYTDDCLGRFVEGLRALPSWERTLVVILPDHGVISREGQGRTSPEVVQIPIVMCGGAVHGHRDIAVLMNQSDLAATLLGQLGIDHEDFLFSRDVLSQSYTYPTAVHCSHDEISFFDSTGVSIYDFNAARIIGGTGGTAEEQRTDKGKAVLQTLFLDASGR